MKMRKIFLGIVSLTFLFVIGVIPGHAQKEVSYLSLADYTEIGRASCRERV